MREEDFYKPEDFHVGMRITIYGRDCLIYDCDAFTRQWYAAHLNREQKAVALKTPPPTLQYQSVPPATGYGSPEDSLGSVIALMPKAPKTDMKKMFK